MSKLTNIFIVSLGTNLGDRLANISKARNILGSEFKLLESSPIVESEAVDYLSQPKFLNQCLVFKNTSKSTPEDILTFCLEAESTMGRERVIDKGPRIIDIDLLFYEDSNIDKDFLTLPHPRLFERSFIVEPLSKLNIFDDLSSIYKFPKVFSNSCWTYEP